MFQRIATNQSTKATRNLINPKKNLVLKTLVYKDHRVKPETKMLQRNKEDGFYLFGYLKKINLSGAKKSKEKLEDE